MKCCDIFGRHLTGDDSVVGLLDLGAIPRVKDFVVPELVLSRAAIVGLLGFIGASVRVQAVCGGQQTKEQSRSNIADKRSSIAHKKCRERKTAGT